MRVPVLHAESENQGQDPDPDQEGETRTKTPEDLDLEAETGARREGLDPDQEDAPGHEGNNLHQCMTVFSSPDDEI